MRSDTHIRRRNRRKSLKRAALNLSILLIYTVTAAVSGISAVILSAAYDITGIKDNSLSPYVSAGDLLILNRAAYIENEPEEGDLVIYETAVHGRRDRGVYDICRVKSCEDKTVKTITGRTLDKDMITGRIEIKTGALDFMIREEQR